MPDGIEKAKIWRELRISMLALRQSELCAELLKIERNRQPKRPKKIKPLTSEERVQRIKKMIGIKEGYDGTKNPELTRPPVPSIPSQSDPIAPNPI